MYVIWFSIRASTHKHQHKNTLETQLLLLLFQSVYTCLLVIYVYGYGYTNSWFHMPLFLSSVGSILFAHCLLLLQNFFFPPNGGK